MKFKDIPDLTVKDRERIKEYIPISDPDECWEWQGNTDGRYGKTSVGSTEYKAHRIAYYLFTGRKPSPTKDLCHTCDNPPCVNPNHLFEGSRSANLVDSVKKGRWGKRKQLKGDWHPDCIYPDDLVQRVRKVYATGLASTHEIAKWTGMARSLVHRIVSGNQRGTCEVERTRQQSFNRLEVFLANKYETTLIRNTAHTKNMGISSARAGYTLVHDGIKSTAYTFTEIYKVFGVSKNEINKWVESRMLGVLNKFSKDDQ